MRTAAHASEDITPCQSMHEAPSQNMSVRIQPPRLAKVHPDTVSTSTAISSKATSATKDPSEAPPKAANHHLRTHPQTEFNTRDLSRIENRFNATAFGSITAHVGTTGVPETVTGTLTSGFLR